VPENKNNSIGPRQQFLIGLARANHHINRIKVARIRPMPRQNAPRQRTLQRRKPKQPTRIAPQNELHQPVA
jgi:hypothetical protein